MMMSGPVQQSETQHDDVRSNSLSETQHDDVRSGLQKHFNHHIDPDGHLQRTSCSRGRPAAEDVLQQESVHIQNLRIVFMKQHELNPQ